MLDDYCSIKMDESSIVQDVLLEVRNYVQNKAQPSAAYLHSPCISVLHLESNDKTESCPYQRIASMF